MKRRILSIVLSLFMIFSLLPQTAFAEEISRDSSFREASGEQFAEEGGITEEISGQVDTVTGDAIVVAEEPNDTEDGSQALRQEWLNMKEASAVRRAKSPVAPSVAAASAGPSALKVGQGTKNTKRYTVLVLDASGSMSGTPMNTMKSAAIKFCEQVLKASGENYVAVVSYATSGYTRYDFSNDLNSLTNSIKGISATGVTNTNDGLVIADKLLSKIPSEQGTIKNILLLSDGLPNTGQYETSGRYIYNDYYYYEYANKTYNTAISLHDKGYYVYTLGFFHSLYSNELTFARKFMNDLQNAGYYDVVNVNELEFVFGEIAKEILKKTGTFRYRSGDSDYEATYYYDDTYFFDSSYAYNESLATMSLCLAMSAFATSQDVPYTHKSANALDLLEQIGFTGITTNYWYTVKPTRDSIGAIAANKTIEVNKKEYTLIAVALRGGGYESEWASNFTIGNTGIHQGFNEAKNNVLDFIRDYIDDKEITGDIKLWITGFSRAAATTNLVAGALDEGFKLPNCTLNLSDLYAYCFETPAGAIAADANTHWIYKNIFNIINYNDPVTKVAPATMGFRRYGVDKRLPDPLTDRYYLSKKSKMIAKYNALPSTNGYIVDNFSMKKISVDIKLLPPSVKPTIVDDKKNQMIQGAFLDTFINKLVKEQIKSRSNYVSKYQDGIREIFGVLNGTEDEQWEDFKQRFEAKLKSNIGWLIASTTPIGEMILGSTVELIEEYAIESLNEAGITQYNKDQIHRLALTLAGTIMQFAISHPNLTTTLVCNLKGMESAHFPELCLAWLQSMDKNYTTNAGQSFSNGAYRIIRINCPVDVEVFDDTDTLVSSITDDTPLTATGCSIVTVINEDDEKLVYLPADAEYRIRLTATGNGKMTFAINEFNCDMGDIARIINYNDIPIQQGNTFASIIPAYQPDDFTDNTEKGSSINYSLTDEDHTPIDPNVDLSGYAAAEAYYMVTVEASNNEYGFVSGQGVRQLGNYAMVTATAYEGCKFEGWYHEEQLVSTDMQYRFRVESDVELTAKFTKPDVGTKYLGTENPSPITGVSNGTAKTAEALGLPANILIDTTAGKVSASVIWDVDNCDYKPTSGNEQTFSINGIVQLPAGIINPNNVSLAVTISVSVNAAIVPPTIAPASSNTPTVAEIKLPVIKDSDIKGWKSITQSITENAREVVILMNGSTVVPKELLDVIRDKEKKATIILDNGVEWVINGKNIPENTETSKLQDINLATALVKTTSSEENLAVKLTFAQDQELHFDITLRIPFEKAQIGKIANIYVENKTSEKPELHFVEKILFNGYMEVSLTKLQAYTLIISDKMIVGDILQSITVTPAKKTLYVGGNKDNKFTLQTELPQVLRKASTCGYCDIQVTYRTDNKKVATVSAAGRITAKKTGKATITTTVTVNGETVSFQTVVTVKKAYITITESTDSLRVGETYTFKAKGYGVDVKTIRFTTSKVSIVTIDKKTGKAKAVSAGTDYVIAKAGNIKVTKKVKVKK